VSANTGAETRINQEIASRIERIKLQFSVLSGLKIAACIFWMREITAFCYLCIRSMEINPGQILSIALASVPTMLTVLMGILINNSRLGDVNSRINDLRSHMDSRFDEMRSTGTSELRRVEEVIDARLKHLEQR